jgi:hypothetical protein
VGALLSIVASTLLSTSPCTQAAAKRAVLAAPLPKLVKDVTRGKYGTGPGAGGSYVRFCADFTADGQPDMVLGFSSGGTAGDTGWFVFRGGAGGGWQLVLKRLKLYKVGVFRAGGDLVESQPVYRKNDPNCCPTGGFDRVRFHWDGSRFVVARRWHDRRPTP